MVSVLLSACLRRLLLVIVKIGNLTSRAMRSGQYFIFATNVSIESTKRRRDSVEHGYRVRDPSAKRLRTEPLFMASHYKNMSESPCVYFSA